MRRNASILEATVIQQDDNLYLSLRVEKQNAMDSGLN